MATATEQTPTNDDGQQELSLRDTLDDAFDKHATDEVDEPRKTAPAAPAEPAQAQAPGADARARDEHGRFVPKGEQAAADPGAAAPVAKPAAAAPAQPTQAPQPGAAADLKAPPSWRPQAREKWASADPEVKAEVYRREHEMQQVLHQTAQVRQFNDAFERTVAPYEMFIREENVTPLQAVQNLMQAAATLRVGTPMTKAQLVANIIQQHGVDIQTLDHIMAGMAPPQGAQQQQFQDPRIDSFLAQQNAIMQAVVARQDEEMRLQLTTFAQGHEFYTDVAGTMADIVESRARRNEPIDLEKIYEQACRMDDNVSTILTQRAAAARSNGNSQAVLRARRAASSVKGDTTPHDGATVPKNDSVRAALEAAFEARSQDA